jgi:hypothetical protein
LNYGSPLTVAGMVNTDRCRDCALPDAGATAAMMVLLNPTDASLSLDDVRVIINSTLERQVKSSNELMRRLVEERDAKNL